MEVIRKRIEDKEVDHMAQAKMGDTVKVHYTGKLGTGVYSIHQKEAIRWSLRLDQALSYPALKRL